MLTSKAFLNPERPSSDLFIPPKDDEAKLIFGGPSTIRSIHKTRIEHQICQKRSRPCSRYLSTHCFETLPSYHCSSFNSKPSRLACSQTVHWKLTRHRFTKGSAEKEEHQEYVSFKAFTDGGIANHCFDLLDTRLRLYLLLFLRGGLLNSCSSLTISLFERKKRSVLVVPDIVSNAHQPIHDTSFPKPYPNQTLVGGRAAGLSTRGLLAHANRNS